MSEPINDGGPAFPALLTGKLDSAGKWIPDATDGMSLRDWFAGQALSSYEKWGCISAPFDMAALECYAMADAMLRARNVDSVDRNFSAKNHEPSQTENR